jgi:radical SAM superfamily enzyme YgiQ (UPF0313 family)
LRVDGVFAENAPVRVLLINAPPHQRVDEYDTPNFTRLGLASLASALRATHGAQVAIVDGKFERLNYEQIGQRIQDFSPDVVGLTAFTNEIKPAARVAAMVKDLSPSIATIIGGVHTSALPEQTLNEFPAFDMAAVGEGELTVRDAVAALDSGSSLEAVAGLCLRGPGGDVHRTAERQTVTNLDEFPPPAWDLLPPSERYLFMTQRGCAYRCTFCMNPNGRTVRTRSVEHVIAELETIVARGGRELYMCDELFTANRERTHQLLDAMIAADIGRKLRWSAQTHVNLVDRELFAKMKAAGCFICGLGIETGDPDIMKRMQKGSTMDRVMTARQAARDAGLPIEGLMIIGHPHETWETAMRTIDFAVKLNPERPIIGVMVPYPGTQVAAMAARGEGGYRLLSTDWNDYAKQIGNALAFENLTRRQLEILQMLAYARVFVGNRRWREFAEFVWKYRSEGWAVVRKILSGKMPVPEHDRPSGHAPGVEELRVVR